MNEVQTSKTDIAVVGAGIVGVCCALYLQKAGFEVTIYDRDGVAQGASKGNAGHFATEQVFPLADAGLLGQIPKMLLDPLGPFRIQASYLFKAMPWFLRFMANMAKSKFNRNKVALKALNEAAMAAYEPLIDSAGLHHMFHREGSLLVSEQADPSQLQKVYRDFKTNGVEVAFLHRPALIAMEPNLSDKVQYGIYFKQVGHTTDPELLTKGLFDDFVNRGGKFCKVAINQIDQVPQGVELLTEQKVCKHDSVVVASGAWSKKLVNKLGYKVPLDTERGYHLMLPETGKLSIPVASLERKFIMTPMSAGLRLAGTVEFAGLEAPAVEARAHALLPHAKALLTDPVKHQAKDLSNWMGFRPSLPDSLPVIGRAPNHEQIYFAFGHQHLGLTQGAITGLLISQLLQRQPTDLDLCPYSISRFQ